MTVEELITQLGISGGILFVVWKIAMRMIAAWREATKERGHLEHKRLDQQHEEHKRLSESIECLSDRVHENTQTMERFISCMTPPEGMRAVRLGD